MTKPMSRHVNFALALCTVLVGGRLTLACTAPASDGGAAAQPDEPRADTSGLVVTYDDNTSVFNFSLGGPKIDQLWPNDPGVNCYVSDGAYSPLIGKMGTNLNGINVSIAGSCTFLGEAGPASGDTAWCTGTRTGQKASANVEGNTWNFNPGYCCASMGGADTHC